MPYSRFKSSKSKSNSQLGSSDQSQHSNSRDRIFRGQGKITAIQVQKTNVERVNIFIDENYAFSLAAIVAVEQQLRPGLELSRGEIAELQTADLYSLALTAALDFLALRPRSKAEVRQRLKRRYPDAPAETFTRVLDRLSELKYLNDADFAKYWIENRAAFAPRGRQLLKQELMQKGVSREIIETALENYLETASLEQDEEEGEDGGLNIEESQALELARKKARSYAAEDWAAFYRKLSSFLLRRGYDYGIAGRITKQVWQELKGRQVEEGEDEPELN